MNEQLKNAILNQLKDEEHGYVYDDGSYSNEREPRAATVVPRRKREGDVWSHEARCWMRDGAPVDPDEVPPGALIQLESTAVDTSKPSGVTVDDVLNSLSVDAQMEMLAKLQARATPPADTIPKTGEKDVTPLAKAPVVETQPPKMQLNIK